jgi:hypothetical protein
MILSLCKDSFPEIVFSICSRLFSFAIRFLYESGLIEIGVISLCGEDVLVSGFDDGFEGLEGYFP